MRNLSWVTYQNSTSATNAPASAATATIQPKGASMKTQPYGFCKARGCAQFTRNYRCRGGEIDLIMQQDDYLVFVEVRFRAGRSYGGQRRR